MKWSLHCSFEVQALVKKTPLEESFLLFFFSSFPYVFSMQKYSLDVIGTHLDIYIDTTEEISLFESIWNRLQDFEKKYSRFLEWNWLSDLNKTRRWILDRDSRNMIEYALEVAQNTNGYFDPTIGKRLSQNSDMGTKISQYLRGIHKEKKIPETIEILRLIEMR